MTGAFGRTVPPTNPCMLCGLDLEMSNSTTIKATLLTNRFKFVPHDLAVYLHDQCNVHIISKDAS